MNFKITLLLGTSLSLFAASVHADSAWSRDKATTQASVDLDGDGNLDKIKLEKIDSRDSEKIGYKLSINGAVAYGSTFDDGYQKPEFFIADINREDRFKEIVITFEGNSGAADGTIYWYDGRKIQRVYKIDTQFLTFKGNGTVAVGYWNSFWTRNHIFKLNKAHRLTEVPQKYYLVNIKGTVSQALPLRKQPDKAGNVATLPAGTKVTVVKANSKSDENQWYLVRANNGKTGWMRGNEMSEHISGLPFAG